MSSLIFFLLDALVGRCLVFFAGTDWTSIGTGTDTSGIMGPSATRGFLAPLQGLLDNQGLVGDQERDFSKGLPMKTKTFALQVYI